MIQFIAIFNNLALPSSKFNGAKETNENENSKTTIYSYDDIRGQLIYTYANCIEEDVHEKSWKIKLIKTPDQCMGIKRMVNRRRLR